MPWLRSRQEGQSQHPRFPASPWTTPPLTQPISSMSSRVSHQTSVTPKPFGGLGNPAQLPPSSQNLLPQPLSRLGGLGLSTGNLEKEIHGMLWGTQQWDCPKLPGAGKGSMS